MCSSFAETTVTVYSKDFKQVRLDQMIFLCFKGNSGISFLVLIFPRLRSSQYHLFHIFLLFCFTPKENWTLSFLCALFCLTQTWVLQGFLKQAKATAANGKAKHPPKAPESGLNYLRTCLTPSLPISFAALPSHCRCGASRMVFDNIVCDFLWRKQAIVATNLREHLSDWKIIF